MELLYEQLKAQALYVKELHDLMKDLETQVDALVQENAMLVDRLQTYERMANRDAEPKDSEFI